MKKRVDLYGTLEFPLTKGYSAFIRQEQGEPIRTTPVKHFITLPSGLVYFQTRNTHYYLHPPASVAAKGGHV